MPAGIAGRVSSARAPGEPGSLRRIGARGKNWQARRSAQEVGRDPRSMDRQSSTTINRQCFIFVGWPSRFITRTPARHFEARPGRIRESGHLCERGCSRYRYAASVFGASRQLCEVLRKLGAISEKSFSSYRSSGVATSGDGILIASAAVRRPNGIRTACKHITNNRFALGRASCHAR